MPVSDYRQISDVLHMVVQLAPRRMLDIGVGFGKWGVLCREVLDVSNGRLRREDWSTRIDGIEVFEPYRNGLWMAAYDDVFIGDALSVIDGCGRYDVILACDVVEHLEKPDGQALIGKMLQHAGVVIITSPRGFVPQEPEFENPNEEHRSGWVRADFAGFPHLYRDIGGTFMAVLAATEGGLRDLSVPFSPLDQLGVKRGIRELARMIARRARTRILGRPRMPS